MPKPGADGRLVFPEVLSFDNDQHNQKETEITDIYLTDKRVMLFRLAKDGFYLPENKPFYKRPVILYFRHPSSPLPCRNLFSLSQADYVFLSIQHCRLDPKSVVTSLPPKTRCREHVMHITFNA